MIWTKLCVLVYVNVWRTEAVKLDVVKCGVDDDDTVEGSVINSQYPWLGVLFYSFYSGMGETRSVTTVVLIHVEFVLANSADIGPMPKQAFRDKARVLLGEGWERGGRRVRNYVVHPEYTETVNSVALIHLSQPVGNPKIIPICPPPQRLRQSLFWVVKFENDLDRLEKWVLPVSDVPADMCRDFYIDKSLYEAKRRPSYVKCVVTLTDKMPCVWGAGSALVTRDVWGRWQLLGLGVYGPGCGAPARFLDMMRYYPWIEDSLDKFQRITISQIHQHKYVLRSGAAFGTVMRFGDCDAYEKQNLIYRDYVNLYTDQTNVKIMKYNMTIFDSVQYTCVVFELLMASASAQLRVRHFCPRGSSGAACYAYKGTRFDISVDVLFTEGCVLDIKAFGLHYNMSLLDIQAWKWEEGTYYEDFRLTPVEYRGPTHMTLFGFEPLDEKMWVPDYDRWSTTPYEFISRTPRYVQEAKDDGFQNYFMYEAGTAPPPPPTKKWLKWFSKKTKRPWEKIFEDIPGIALVVTGRLAVANINIILLCEFFELPAFVGKWFEDLGMAIWNWFVPARDSILHPFPPVTGSKISQARFDNAHRYLGRLMGQRPAG